MPRSAAIVIIGLNEGAHLQACLHSCMAQSDVLVYVDSGSSDNSLAIATDVNVPTMPCDGECPMTAAKARNTGFDWIRHNHPEVEYVQFVDGDCELVEGWLASGVDFLETESNVAIIYGQLSERYPERSVYNLLADIEWNTPPGEVFTSGGNFLTRAEVFESVNGFRTDLVAGEEPELCVRLRQQGWKLHKIDCAMALHDSNMHHFGEWWKRSIRDGYSFAEGMGLHGQTNQRHYVRETRSAIAWGVIIPLGIIAVSLLFDPSLLLLLLVYPIQVLRVSLKGRRDLLTNIKWSFFIVLRKFPECLGAIKYAIDRCFRGSHSVAK